MVEDNEMQIALKGDLVIQKILTERQENGKKREVVVVGLD